MVTAPGITCGGVKLNLDESLFCLPATFQSGHLFYWWCAQQRGREVYVWPTRGHVLRLWREGPVLRGAGGPPALVREALGLAEPYEEIVAALGRRPGLRPALERFVGLRLLRQDPWECSLGFLNATLSSVKRVQGHLHDLAHHHGDRVGDTPLLPAPSQLPDEAALRALGLGYRARHLHRLATLLRESGGETQPAASAWLLSHRSPCAEATLKNLMALPGVGRKVASCIALYSLGVTDAVPMDVWMIRVLGDLFGAPPGTPARSLEDMARRRFGPHAGYAQQFLYSAARGA